MKHVTNLFSVPESLQLWLLDDNYNHGARDEKTFSATEIIRHPRQIILSRRATANGTLPVQDYAKMINSRRGQTIHAGIEWAWRDAITDAQECGDYSKLKAIGWDEELIDSIIVNPSLEQLKANPDCMPVYLEHRVTMQFGEFAITGELDFCIDGQLEDFKETKTYSYSTDLNSKKYAQQGSVYRAIFTEAVITEPTVKISFLFKDFKASQKGTPNYPPCEVASKEYELESVTNTKRFLKDKLILLDTLKDTPEPELPLCDDDTLMVRPFSYAYYSKEGAKRASKVSDNYDELAALLKEKGTGHIETRGGEVIGCLYCDAWNECTQKDTYLANGRLTLQ